MTSNHFFTKTNDRTNNYLEDLWSKIVVTFILRKQQTIEYKTQLTTKSSIPEYIYKYIDISIYIYISQQSILKQGFQKTHFPTVLEVKIFLLSIWLTSRRCAKLQIPISILTWFFRHLNMAFLGYFT